MYRKIIGVVTYSLVTAGLLYHYKAADGPELHSTAAVAGLLFSPPLSLITMLQHLPIIHQHTNQEAFAHF